MLTVIVFLFAEFSRNGIQYRLNHIGQGFIKNQLDFQLANFNKKNKESGKNFV